MEEEGKVTDRKASSGNRNGQIYFIGGVRVPFPAKAYPSQITMMHKIIRGLDRKQNCLLESPTGSGKTLALLCSSLAWQKHEREKAKTPKSSGEKKPETLVPPNNEIGEHSKYFDANKKDLQDTVKDESEAKFVSPIPRPSSSFAGKTDQPNQDGDVGNDDSDPDFQSARKRFRTPSGGLPNSKRQKSLETPIEPVPNVDLKEPPVAPPNWKMELTTDATKTPEALIDEEKLRILRKNMSDEEKMKQDKPRIPRIYFGTRTHKQIAQIVRELKKTEFKTCRMTILSSREHSCIHPKVSTGKDKNEECRRHVKGIENKSCKYHQNVSQFCRPPVQERYNLNTSWDIEDLVTAGKKAMACPYYAARELMDKADIIFCPYNYLVDPHIRSQMNIDITDEIIVLDEAHNIEDSSRDAASITVTSTQLEETMEELNKQIYYRVLPDSHQAMHTLCSIIYQWLQSLSDSLTRTGFETAAKVFHVDQMVARLETIQITPSTFPIYKEEFAKITAAEFDPSHITNIDAPKLTTKAKTTINGLIITLEKVLDKEKRYNDDFRIAVSRKSSTTRRLSDMGGGWRTSRNQAVSKSWEYSLNVWCLNPAVVFSGIGTTARCIVLTSGTLSPMSSFSSELGVSFPIQLEANHVIQDSQAWVGALTVGPDNKNIIANYQSSETFAFQDGVGRIILQVCKIVPHGVLCFFASYSMLEKLKRRWMSTGLWEDICRKKDTYSEPRGSDRFALDEIMQDFYHSCESSGQYESSRNGALLLAVCRGKISEGLDFSDDNARAVITIGIPFPDFKDPQVELKRKYNSDHCAARGLLNGSEWYEIQAYRALNQALGRCIRHRNDWGAIILVDERFGRSPKYKNGLSKWVRGRCRLFNDFHKCISSVAAFAEARRLDPCPGAVKTESSISPPTLEQKPSIAPASNESTSCCDKISGNAFVSPDAVKTPQSTSCLDTKSAVFEKQEEPSTPQIVSCQDVKSHSSVLAPGELRPLPSTSCLNTKSTGVFVKQELGTPVSTSCQNTNNTYIIIKPNALGTPQVTPHQDTILHSTIVRPDELRTPQIKGQQNPPRNLNIELKAEENSNSAPKTGPIILNVANQPLQNMNIPIRLIPIQLMQNVNVGQATFSPNISMAPSVANCGNKIPIAPLKSKNEPIKLIPIQHLQNANASQVKCCENIPVASSTVLSGNTGSSSDSVPGRKCQDSWKNTVNAGSNANKEDRKETPPCVFKPPPGQTCVDQKPRYNSFDNLLKPILQSSQSSSISVPENSKPGRVNLFKTTSLCSSETVVKEEKSLTHKVGLGDKRNHLKVATKSLVNFENDGFLEDFNDKELKEIDFDAFEPKKMNANVVKCEPGACSTRENSPNLFSNSSAVMEDVDCSAVYKETGNEGGFVDDIDKSIEASWDDGFQIPEEFDAEEFVCGKGGKSSKSKNADCKVEDSEGRRKRNQKRNSVKKRTEKVENSSKKGKKFDNEDCNKSEGLQDKVEAVDDGETPKVGRKRTSSRRQSNLRMSSRKKKGGTTSDIDFNEVGDHELDMPANKSKSMVSCLYCNCSFTTTDNPRISEEKSSVLPCRSGSASKGIRIFESSLKDLKNFRQNVKQHDCECKINGLELNSIFSEEESMVFVPLFCDSCYSKRKPKTSLIGFKFIRIGSPSDKVETPNSSNHDVWLLADKITISKEK